MKNNDLILHNITAPNLDSSEFGKNISEQFEHINSNFRKLSNYDFIKGDDGKSIELKEIKLSKNPNIINKLKNAIKNHVNNIGLETIYDNNDTPINWDDNFINNPGTLLLMYKNDKVISSMAYIYIDPRFGQNVANLAKIKINEYQNITDCSCVIYFDKYIDEEISFICVDLFPTLYYDETTQNFCWKMWGQKTGLIANGPSGKDAGSGTVNLSDKRGRDIDKVKIILD